MDLKLLRTEDVTKNYVDWFSDKDVTRYSNAQYYNFTLKGQKAYVEESLKNDDILLYGILLMKSILGI